MAFKKQDLIKKALDALDKNEILFIEELVHFLPCSKPTFYKHELNEVNEIKEKIEANKVKIKTFLRADFKESKHAAERLALYRLVSTPDEHRRLNTSYQEKAKKGKSKPFDDVPDADLAKEYDRLANIPKASKNGSK